MSERGPLHFDNPTAEFAHRLGNALFAFETLSAIQPDRRGPEHKAELQDAADEFFNRFDDWRERFSAMAHAYSEDVQSVEQLRNTDWSDPANQQALMEAYHRLHQRISAS